MGVLEFQKLPVNTLVGADWKTFKGITQGQTIELPETDTGPEIRQTPERSGDQHGAGFYSRALA